jgi:hypothetical protein
LSNGLCLVSGLRQSEELTGTLAATACGATALSAWLAVQAEAGRRPALPLPARTDRPVSPR